MTTLSPLDARYAEQTRKVRDIFCEKSFTQTRIEVMVQWANLVYRAKFEDHNKQWTPLIRLPIPKGSSEKEELEYSLVYSASRAKEYDESRHDLFHKGPQKYFYQPFTFFPSENPDFFEKVKAIEKVTNHDIKAVEYYIKNELDTNERYPRLIFPEIDNENKESKREKLECVHFGLTSEDVNSVCYGIMLSEMRDLLVQQLENLGDEFFRKRAGDWAREAMLARTHGQAATPTTMGKEVANFGVRLFERIKAIEKVKIRAKLNGATGNSNALFFARPDVDWETLKLGMLHSCGLDSNNNYTTQIEPHDYMAQLFHELVHLSKILTGFCQDMWGYISLGYFTQKLVEGEVGSSVMPHKVNPIKFENAEANFGLASALFTFMADKLVVSRFQRDLSDSSVLRNVGVAFGYLAVALESLQDGLKRVELCSEALQNDLSQNWQVLGEAVQTVMRDQNISGGYEKLKEFSRGKVITPDLFRAFVSSIEDLDPSKRDKLLQLLPSTYIGKAPELALAFANKTVYF